MSEIFIYLSGFGSAILASLIGAFSGGGASLILLPMLLTVSSGTYIAVLTTTKISSTVMSFIATTHHYKRVKFHKGLITVLVIAGIIGTMIGTYIVQYQSNEELFKQVLGIILLGTAFYMILTKNVGMSEEHRQINHTALMVIGVFSLASNILNGIFGGTGIYLTVFLVMFLKMRFIRAIAYTMITHMTVNMLQSIYLIRTVDFSFDLSFYVVLGSILGAFLGTQLQTLKGDKWVRVASISVMGIVGLKMLFSSFF